MRFTLASVKEGKSNNLSLYSVNSYSKNTVSLANLPVCFFEIIQRAFLYPSLQEDTPKPLIQAYQYTFILAETETEDIKKKWQEYTELYKKDLQDPDNHDGMITHLEPDILECEVKWALRSITMNKASGSDGIPVKLFQILKDDAVKGLYSISQQIWKTQQWPQDRKWSVFIPIPKKGNVKECSNYHTVALISHASKVMLKILQARL